MTTTESHPRSRRALLAGVLGGLGAVATAAIARLDPAAAAAGDPIRMGRLNRASGSSTELQTSSSKPAFWARQLGGGSAVRGEAGSGRAVMATTGAAGTAVWAHSPDHYGVFAATESGIALNGQSISGTGVYAFSQSGLGVYAESFSGPAVFALSHTGYAGDFSGKVRLTGVLDVAEIGDGVAAAPPTDVARLFVHDKGSGKTELCVRFPTGAVQVIATEP